MSDSPLILVHPFFKLEERVAKKYYCMFPHLVALRRYLVENNPDLLVLEGEDKRKTRRVLKELGHQGGLSFITTCRPTSPEPKQGWNYLERALRKYVGTTIKIGGGFYEPDGDGCVNGVMGELRRLRYEVELVDNVTFSRNSLAQGIIRLHADMEVQTRETVSLLHGLRFSHSEEWMF